MIKTPEKAKHLLSQIKPLTGVEAVGTTCQSCYQNEATFKTHEGFLCDDCKADIERIAKGA